MCRGCSLHFGEFGEYREDSDWLLYDYLDWQGMHQGIIAAMKKHEKAVLEYQDKLTNQKNAEVIDRYRRQLIKLRREYAKADEILNEVNR